MLGTVPGILKYLMSVCYDLSFFFLSRYNWYVTLYWGYNTVIWYLCCKMITMVSVVKHPSPLKLPLLWGELLRSAVINLQICSPSSLAVVTLMYVTSPWFIYFYNWKFVFFDPPHPFRKLPRPVFRPYSLKLHCVTVFISVWSSLWHLTLPEIIFFT